MVEFVVLASLPGFLIQKCGGEPGTLFMQSDCHWRSGNKEIRGQSVADYWIAVEVYC